MAGTAVTGLLAASGLETEHTGDAAKAACALDEATTPVNDARSSTIRVFIVT